MQITKIGENILCVETIHQLDTCIVKARNDYYVTKTFKLNMQLKQ